VRELTAGAPELAWNLESQGGAAAFDRCNRELEPMRAPAGVLAAVGAAPVNLEACRGERERLRIAVWAAEASELPSGRQPPEE
jgi:hypothetical protein